MLIIEETEKMDYRLFTVKDLCKRYGISKYTVYKWISLDIVPYTRIGRTRTLRFIPEHIKEWEERKSSGKVKVDLI